MWFRGYMHVVSVVFYFRLLRVLYAVLGEFTCLLSSNSVIICPGINLLDLNTDPS